MLFYAGDVGLPHVVMCYTAAHIFTNIALPTLMNRSRVDGATTQSWPRKTGLTATVLIALDFLTIKVQRDRLFLYRPTSK